METTQQIIQRKLTHMWVGKKTAKPHWLAYTEHNGKTDQWICSNCQSLRSVTKDPTPFCPICSETMLDIANAQDIV